MTHREALQAASEQTGIGMWVIQTCVGAYLEARAVDAVSDPWPEQETQGNFARYLLRDFGEER